MWSAESTAGRIERAKGDISCTMPRYLMSGASHVDLLGKLADNAKVHAGSRAGPWGYARGSGRTNHER